MRASLYCALVAMLSDRFLPFSPYSRYLRDRFGGPVRKLCVDAGFTCPNLDGSKGTGGCAFCNNAAFSAGSRGNRRDLATQVEAGRRYLSRRYGESRYILYFQAFSNTYASLPELDHLYRLFQDEPDVVGIAVGTRPDCIDGGVVELLDGLATETHVTLELGIQTVHDGSLRRVRRGHTWGESRAALELAAGRRFDLCLHAILGLPGEGEGEIRETAETLARFPYHSLKLHNLHIVHGTDLAEPYRVGRIHLPDRATYISWVADFLERTPPTVALQRLVGDAPPNLLISEAWCHDKPGLYRDLLAEFHRRSTHQGIYAPTPLPLAAGA